MQARHVGLGMAICLFALNVSTCLAFNSQHIRLQAQAWCTQHMQHLQQSDPSRNVHVVHDIKCIDITRLGVAEQICPSCRADHIAAPRLPTACPIPPAFPNNNHSLFRSLSSAWLQHTVRPLSSVAHLLTPDHTILLADTQARAYPWKISPSCPVTCSYPLPWPTPSPPRLHTSWTADLLWRGPTAPPRQRVRSPGHAVLLPVSRGVSEVMGRRG